MKVARVTLSFPISMMTVVEFHREPDKIQYTFLLIQDHVNIG